jgi:SMC interacting uncharacterized protein involved in chromosome segregation
MSTYDARQMAKDALAGAPPPAYSGIKEFISAEGVYALATALEENLDHQEGRFKLEEARDDLQEEVNSLTEKLKQIESDLESANAKIGEARECLS